MSEYRDYGWEDAAPTQAHDFIYPVLRAMLADDRQRSILDVGCGNGAVALALLEEGYDVVGLDASESGIALANAKHPGRFFTHDLAQEGLPPALAGRCFDLIISTEVVEHLYDPRRYVRFCRAALKPGGEIMISTPYHGYLKNLVMAVFGKMDKHFTVLWDGGHIKFWSRRTLTALLEESGFCVTEFRGAGRFPYLWKSMLIRAKLAE
ncbi:MAG: class I SAM-dependent methyltransferase [Burkholderiales bacterium]